MKIKIGDEDVTKMIGSPSWVTDDETNGTEMSFSSLMVHDVGSLVKVSDGGQVRFYGIIVTMDENVRPPYSYKALDFSYNLKGEEIIQFKNMAADSAIKKLLSNQGISSQVCPIPTKINKIYKDTVAGILKDILKTAKKDQGKGYFFEVDGNKVVVEEKKKIKIHPSFLISDEAPITRSIEDLKNEVKVVHDNKVIASASDAASIKTLGTVRKVEEIQENITTAKAQNVAKQQLKDLNRMKSVKQVTLLVTDGYWDIKKNRLIKLKGGGLDGWYRIRSSSHSIEGDVHKVEIEVSWDAAF